MYWLPIMAGAVRSSRISNSGRASSRRGLPDSAPVFLERVPLKKRGMSVTVRPPCHAETKPACRSAFARPYFSYNRHELPSPSNIVPTGLELTEGRLQLIYQNFRFPL